MGDDLGSMLVSFKADLSNLTSGVDKAIAQINSVGTATEEAAAKVAGASSEIENSMTGVAESSERTSGGFASHVGSMAGKLLDFGAKIGQTVFGLQMLGQMTESAASSLLGPAISAETVTTALTTLDGSAKAAADEMSNLNQFAAKTPFKTLDIDTAAEQLQGFGYKAQDVIPDITAIGDALGSVGRETPAELDSVVQIFGKMRTEGKVTQMTMNELAVHGIDGWKALSDATGKTIPQLKEMIKQGLLPASDAVADLTKGIEMNPLYKGGMARAAGTFTGLLSTLASNWDQVVAAFGTPIIKGLEGSLNNLGNILASPGFQSFAGSVGKGIVNVFSDIGGIVDKAMPQIEHFGYFLQFAGSIGGKAWKDVKDILFQVKEIFKPISDSFAGFTSGPGQAFSDLISKMFPLVQNFGDGFQRATYRIEASLSSINIRPFIDGFKSLAGPAQTVLGALRDGFGQVASIVGGQLSADFKTFTDIAKDLGKWWQSTMWPAIQQALPGFEHLGSVIATTVVPAFAKIWAVGQQFNRDVLPYLIKGFETIAPIVVKVGGFLADNLGKAIQFLTPYIVQAAQAIGQFASDIASRVAPIIQNLWTWIMDGINAIMPVWNAMWPTISAVLKGTWDIITGIIKVAWSIFSGIIKIGLDLLSGNWSKAWDDIKGMFSGIWDGIKTIVKGAWDGIWSIIKNAINWVIGGINNFIGGLDNLHFDMGGIHVGVNIPKIPLLASGGFVPPGGMAIAGEAGPELVMGGASGASVLSNSASRSALGGQQNVHVHVYLDGTELTNQLGHTMVSMARTHGPVGGIGV